MSPTKQAKSQWRQSRRKAKMGKNQNPSVAEWRKKKPWENQGSVTWGTVLLEVRLD